MIELNALLDIEKLGARGEGVSRGPHGLIFTPFALPGEKSARKWTASAQNSSKC